MYSHMLTGLLRECVGRGIPERVISEAASVAFMGVVCALAPPSELPDVLDGDDLLPATIRLPIATTQQEIQDVNL